MTYKINPYTRKKDYFEGDVMAQYNISDLDTASDPQYFGYVDADGAWYIMQLTESTGAARYYKGSSNYAASWAVRSGLSYDVYSAIF